MDRLMFGKKTSSNFPRSRTDRFVSSREHCHKLRHLHRPYHCLEEETFGIWHVKHTQHRNYTSTLDSTFGLDKSHEHDSVPLWPCAPRKKSYLSSADSVLDLPNYSYTAFPELLDWSNDNILVAALGRTYHRWSWRTQRLINQGYTSCDILCCKYDPTGEKLTLGTLLSTVEIHNNKLGKLEAECQCICPKLRNEYCSITALDWSPTGNSFVSGCSQGYVLSFTRSAQHMWWSDVFRSAISILRVSPDARFVAVTCVNSSTVKILQWPTLQGYSDLKGKDCIVKTIGWHPWRSAFLGVGSDCLQQESSIALHNVPTNKLTVAQVAHQGYMVDALLFSDRTGELVISISHSGEETPETPVTQLLVLSGPGTVVDRWSAVGALDCIRTMVFSPDGTKLATATTDEDLVIWNFLPEDRKKKTRKKKFSAGPVYLDKVTSGKSLR